MQLNKQTRTSVSTRARTAAASACSAATCDSNTADSSVLAISTGCSAVNSVCACVGERKTDGRKWRDGRSRGRQYSSKSTVGKR